jgi:hypothetical protein
MAMVWATGPSFVALQTKTDGRVIFRGLVPGTYLVSIEAEGYQSVGTGDINSPGLSADVEKDGFSDMLYIALTPLIPRGTSSIC